MAGSVSLLVGLMFLVALVGSVSSSSKFDDLFQPNWAFDHFTYEGDTLKMKLDNYSGILLKCILYVHPSNSFMYKNITNHN